MNYGFFDTTPYEKENTVPLLPQCGLCKLKDTSTSPKMKTQGKGAKKIMLLFEYPLKKQDHKNNAYVGRSFFFLKKILSNLGIDIVRDCYTHFATICGGNKPDLKHAKHCRPNLIKAIEKLKPKLIICFGKMSINGLIAHKYHKGVGGVTKWRGFTFPDHDYNCWISTVFDPVFVRTHKQKDITKHIFTQDLKNALTYLHMDMPEEEKPENKICSLTKTSEIKSFLKSTLKSQIPFFTFDYETTGLKPHAKGHEIVSCAICHDPDISYAFPFRKEIIDDFCNLLDCPHIKKIAANMKFEELWSRVILKQKVNGWIWDTMLNMHCLDNRSGIASLKFQSVIFYGIYDYDSHISPFLESKENTGNSFNEIHKIDMHDLLLYNGIDSLLEYKIALKQMKFMGILDPVTYFAKNKTIVHKNIHDSNQKYVEHMEEKNRRRQLIKNKTDIRRKR